MNKSSIGKIILSIAIIIGMFFSLVSNSVFASIDNNISIPSGENLVLTYVNNSGSITYNVDSTLIGYYPSVFSLKINSAVGKNVKVSTNNNSTITHNNGDYYLVSLQEGSSTILTITFNNHIYKLNCSKPDGGSLGSLSGIYAFLPGPGQFVNEYMSSGGWGTIYTAGQTAVKAMVDAKAKTGVSLGYFGGYIVLDYGTPIKDSSGNVSGGIYNDVSNKYGVDFILYGNAFNGNSEPGCIQVSSDGSNWYDIAGSLYYDDNTKRAYSLTYKNPKPKDDFDSTYGEKGTPSKKGVSYTGDSIGVVIYNAWHSHSWFPLYSNYFIEQIQSLGRLDKTNILPFVSYEKDIKNGSKLTLIGTMLGDATNTITSNYTFGYCDVHSNGSSTSLAYNPYSATNKTTGGDPIDISWAVDSFGKPVNLNSIRFIRVYTGSKAMNGMFGPISTEVSGSYRAKDTGSGLATTDLNIEYNLNILKHSNMETTDILVSGKDFSLEIYSDEDYIFVNGKKITCTSSSSYNYSDDIEIGESKYIQVITQNKTESPYITVFKVIGH